MTLTRVALATLLGAAILLTLYAFGEQIARALIALLLTSVAVGICAAVGLLAIEIVTPACDSGRLPKGEDPSGAECEASQSGAGTAHRPNNGDRIP